MVTTGRQQDSAGTRAWPAEAERWRDDARRLAEENARLAEENARLSQGMIDLEGRVGALAEKVATYARMLFGDSSERSKAKTKPPLDPDGDQPGQHGGGQAGRRGRGQKRGGVGHGRRDYSDLDTEEQVHDLPPERRLCPECGTAYQRFGEECCEQIDWRVRLVRVVHRRPTYRRACRCRVRGVICAPPPRKAIAKGRFTTGFLARLLWEKFALGLPTHRIAAQLAADGLEVAEGTLAGVFAALSDLLGPLAKAIEARNAASAHLHVDETRWSVFEAVQGKDSNRWWLWVFVADDTTVFRVARSRSLAVLTDHLGLDADAGLDALPEGRTLRLSSDFYSVYQAIGTVDGVDSLWCWAHIRRRFVKARDAHPRLRVWAEDWLDRVGALYAAHKAIGAAEPGGDAHRLATAQFSAALAGIGAERQSQSRLDGLHPAAAKVLATIDREWDGLARHKDYPELPLDNNTAERALRTPVVGRKNFYGSAERAGYNPLAYLTSYLDACATNDAAPPTGDGLARFLPWTASPTDQAPWLRPGAGQPATTPDDNITAPDDTDTPDGPAP